MDTTKDPEIIKPEFVIHDHERVLAVECLSEKDKRKFAASEENVGENDGENKRQKTENGPKKLSGQNKARKNFLQASTSGVVGFCNQVAQSLDESASCPLEKCRFSHDRQAYLETKPPDIGQTCYLFSTQGFCPYGLTCRFSSAHITKSGVNLVDKDLQEKWSETGYKIDKVLTQEVQQSLRKRTYKFTRSENSIKEVDELKAKELKDGSLEDSDLVKLRPEEHKRIDWREKLYLSPLTTVGNLPFRRVCVGFGAEVTCGEMALAQPLLQGKTSEWALVKRHPCEKLFGAQLCGNNVHLLTKAAQAVEETASVDFIDINLGCPIDLVYRQGGGSGMLQRGNVLTSVVRSMSHMLEVPLTVKTRAGVVTGKNIAHTFMPMFKKAGVSLITVHGRSREQRYTKEADWAYIEECALLAKPVPLYGNGDILSYLDYEAAREKAPDVSGVMIGRGALIKPWIFQEIKEKRHLDPSSSQRLDYLKTYVNYGLEHWGSDTRGVETTRRFLLEWLSFLHRYIPTGLLLSPPQRLNSRPPVYRGRDQLETLMASSNSGDWIKIRSREQRYTKEADWAYIEECALLAKPVPLYGNGDILSYLDYEAAREKAPDVSGVMIGRGALIKPWIFQEIKEKRHLDPSSSQRLDYLKTYVNYGLEHWGSDTRGVETTRRFLLEWLSFLHRYIPTGLLLSPPQRLNSRPPVYRGRDQLETLMASSNSGDWIKISEMLLGPVPDGFTFLPKHKANAWK